MEAEERPAKIPRLDPLTNTVETQDASIAASVPGLPPSEAEGTHATSLQDAGIQDDGPHMTEGTASQGTASNLGVELDLAAEAAESAPARGDAEKGEQHLSKSALKKLRKRQAWEAARPARKAARKARVAARKEQARDERARAAATAEKNADAINGSASSLASTSVSSRKRSKRKAAGTTTPLPVGIVLDCGFDELMTDQEITSLSSQVTRCYSDNAHAVPRHARLVVTDLGGRLRQRFETTLAGTHRNWHGIEMHEAGLAEVLSNLTFSPESTAVAAALAAKDEQEKHDTTGDPTTTDAWTSCLAQPPAARADGSIPAARTVYLTADADETLHELRPWETYVVGALVDRNRHKGICRKRAEALGLPMAKLPIAEYLHLPTRQVLATNHVVEIMLRYLAGEGWAGALDSVVPKRKGAVLKVQSKKEGHGEGEVKNEEQGAYDEEEDEGKAGGGEEKEDSRGDPDVEAKAEVSGTISSHVEAVPSATPSI